MKSETTSWEGGVLVFDEKNAITFAGMPDVKAVDLSYENGRLKFKAGEDEVDATVDFEATPPQMKGTVNGKTAFVAKRAERAPRARLVGSWTPVEPEKLGWSELLFDEAGRGVLITDDPQAGLSLDKLDDLRSENGTATFSIARRVAEGAVKYGLKLDRPLISAPTNEGHRGGSRRRGEACRRPAEEMRPTPVGKWRITETDGKPVDPAAQGVTLESSTRESRSL